MNYHTDKWIMDRVMEYYEEAKTIIPEEQIIGIFYQGSGNYGLDTEDSDVDTKLIVVPSLKEIALNQKPISATHIRDNGEHIEVKDVRLLPKQILSFLEILFTPYYMLNPYFADLWKGLESFKEDIVKNNFETWLKAMYGYAKNMAQKDSSKDKELYHLLRIEEFLDRYVNNGERFESCLQSKNSDYLKDLKTHEGTIDQDVKLEKIKKAFDNIQKIYDKGIKNFKINNDNFVKELIEDTQYQFLKGSFKLND